MATLLARGTRIGCPRPDGTLIFGTILGPAFGEGSYRASLMHPEVQRIACVHRGEVVVEPQSAILSPPAAATRTRGQRVGADPGMRVAGGAF